MQVQWLDNWSLREPSKKTFILLFLFQKTNICMYTWGKKITLLLICPLRPGGGGAGGSKGLSGHVCQEYFFFYGSPYNATSWMMGSSMFHQQIQEQWGSNDCRTRTTWLRSWTSCWTTPPPSGSYSSQREPGSYFFQSSVIKRRYYLLQGKRFIWYM